MCGLKRNYEEVKLSLHENLINILLNDGIEIHSFVHSDKSIEIFNLKGIITSAPKKYPNIPYQICRFNECYHNLVLPFMDKNNIQYDFFICTRPDNFYFQYCLLKKIYDWDINKINIRMRRYPKKLDLIYHTGHIDIGNEVVDDQFFIIPKKIANIAFSIKRGNFPIIPHNCHAWGEGQLTDLWNSNNLKFKLFPINVIIHNWRHDKSKKIYNDRKKLETF